MYKLKIPRQIGQIIKDKRLEKGLTQEKLAKSSNTSRSLVYRLEKGTINGIMLDKLFDILKVLELELAVVDAKSTPKSIHAVATGHEANCGQAGSKKRSSSHAPDRNAAVKSGSSRNTQAQLAEELKAVQNITGLDAVRYLER